MFYFRIASLYRGTEYIRERRSNITGMRADANSASRLISITKKKFFNTNGTISLHVITREWFASSPSNVRNVGRLKNNKLLKLYFIQYI